MASGYGLNGGMGSFPYSYVDSSIVLISFYLPWNVRLITIPGPSRCFVFWQELLGCYVVNAGEGDSGKKKCISAFEDYYECLHHSKEVHYSLRNHLPSLFLPELALGASAVDHERRVPG
jgi:hypothetical protein